MTLGHDRRLRFVFDKFNTGHGRLITPERGLSSKLICSIGKAVCATGLDRSIERRSSNVKIRHWEGTVFVGIFRS
jgi:hypothetical protein